MVQPVAATASSVFRGQIRDSEEMIQNQWSNQKEMRAMERHGNQDGSSDDGGDASEGNDQLLSLVREPEDDPSHLECHHGEGWPVQHEEPRRRRSVCTELSRRKRRRCDGVL